MIRIAPEHRITHYFQPKDFISLLNGLLGFLAVWQISQNNLQIASLLIIGATIADVLDGKVARNLTKPTLYGKNIDIADLISFGVAPALLILNWLDFILEIKLLATLCLVAGGLIRLGRFLTREGEGHLGVPITINGILYPFLYLFSANLYEIPAFIIIIITFLQSYFMVSCIQLD